MRLLRLAAVCLPSLVACGAPTETTDDTDRVSSTEQDLLIDAARVWSGSTVPFCWVDDASGFPTEKAWIRQVMHGQRSWEQVSGVHFHEVGACPSDTQQLLAFPGIAMTIGYFGSFNATTTVAGRPMVQIQISASESVVSSVTTCSARGLNREDCVKTTTLHELGHAIGFQHEQLRHDTPASCPEGPGEGTNTFGVWDSESIMNYCFDGIDLSVIDRKGAESVYLQPKTDQRHHGNFDNDSRDDLLCTDAVDGRVWVSHSGTSGLFGGSGLFSSFDFCRQGSLYVADFTGDGKDDILCHDAGNGRVAYRNSQGFTQVNTQFQAFCGHANGRLLVGDFNGDHLADLLCHDVASGWKWIDHAHPMNVLFSGANWSTSANWCGATNGRLLVGDFNGDDKDDLLCHDIWFGHRYIDYSSGIGVFNGTDAFEGDAWCVGQLQELHVGDFNADNRDDLLCFDLATGTRWVDFADTNGRLMGTDAQVTGAWCNRGADRLSIGDFDGDNRDDLLCHDVNTGEKTVVFARASGAIFDGGANAWFNNGWCSHDAGELH